MEKIAYVIKHKLPGLFSFIETISRGVIFLRYKKNVLRAEKVSYISGKVKGLPAEIRTLSTSDADTLTQFIDSLPSDYIDSFKPHSFHGKELRNVIGSRSFLNYGIFLNEELVGYALLRISPTGSAFLGRVVHPKVAGMGLGRFISRFLIWQASIAGFRARATPHRDNQASLRAHQAGGEFKIISDLPNGHILIEFAPAEGNPPSLDIS